MLKGKTSQLEDVIFSRDLKDGKIELVITKTGETRVVDSARGISLEDFFPRVADSEPVALEEAIKRARVRREELRELVRKSKQKSKSTRARKPRKTQISAQAKLAVLKNIKDLPKEQQEKLKESFRKLGLEL